ncbi:MAG: hypothetical protein JW934_07270 [Anaerolineae bacterium]|nr:hypothetical protein [Anaerolineae bacterium]
MTILSGILTLYAWILGAAVVLFMFYIARFYERKYAELYKDASSNRTHYRLFLIPILLFILSALRYALFLGDLAGDFGGDLSFFIGGVVLTILGYRLQLKMTGGQS